MLLLYFFFFFLRKCVPVVALSHWYSKIFELQADNFLNRKILTYIVYLAMRIELLKKPSQASIYNNMYWKSKKLWDDSEHAGLIDKTIYLRWWFWMKNTLIYPNIMKNDVKDEKIKKKQERQKKYTFFL